MRQRVKLQTLWMRPASRQKRQSLAEEKPGAARHRELDPTAGRRRSPAQHEVALRQVQ